MTTAFEYEEWRKQLNLLQNVCTILKTTPEQLDAHIRKMLCDYEQIELRIKDMEQRLNS